MQSKSKAAGKPYSLDCFKSQHDSTIH